MVGQNRLRRHASAQLAQHEVDRHARSAHHRLAAHDLGVLLDSLVGVGVGHDAVSRLSELMSSTGRAHVEKARQVCIPIVADSAGFVLYLRQAGGDSAGLFIPTPGHAMPFEFALLRALLAACAAAFLVQAVLALGMRLLVQPLDLATAPVTAKVQRPRT